MPYAAYSRQLGENALGPDDKEMVVVDKQSEFVKDRVLVLLTKLNRNY